MKENCGNDVLNIVKELMAITFENHPCSDGNTINKGVIQKQLYIAQSISLHFCGIPLHNEPTEAWELGPVVYRVWNTFDDLEEKHRLAESIARRTITSLEKLVLEITYALTKDKNFRQLVDLTHEEGGAWEKYYNKHEKRKVIPNEELANSFHIHRELYKGVKEILSHEKLYYYDENYIIKKGS